MKRNLFLGIIVGLALISCTTEGNKPDTHAAHQATEAATQAANSAISDLSVYNLDTDWTNQQGEPLKLPQLQGKIQLVAMVYTSCTYACPRIVSDLKRIEVSLEKYRKEDVGIVLVTMDPERDTPAQLKAFASENGLDPARWVLLTSKQENIQELAVLLNMKYKNEGNGNIAHSNIISVLNPAGEIIHQQEGLGAEPDETIKAIDALLQRI
ncbi:MAG TPA: SCO family protein [Pontibacter sp.]